MVFEYAACSGGHMTSYYTGRGDKGDTRLIGSASVRKDSDVIDAIGSVDELNSAIGVALSAVDDPRLRDMLLSAQNTLFAVGAELASATSGAESISSKADASKVKELESWISEMSASLPPLNKFVLPGGSQAGAYLHLARSICRRAERRTVAAMPSLRLGGEVVGYLNRLSSFLFVAALYSNSKAGVKEKNPSY